MKVKVILIWNSLIAFVLLAGMFVGLTISVVYDVYNPTRMEITSEYRLYEHFDAWSGEWVLDKKTYIEPIVYVDGNSAAHGFSIKKMSSDGTPVTSAKLSAGPTEAMSYWDTFCPENEGLRAEYWDSITTQVAYYFAMYVQWIPWIFIMAFTTSKLLILDLIVQNNRRKSSR